MAKGAQEYQPEAEETTEAEETKENEAEDTKENEADDTKENDNSEESGLSLRKKLQIAATCISTAYQWKHVYETIETSSHFQQANQDYN